MLKYREKLRKIMVTIMILITCTFAVPNFSQADFGGKLFSPLVNLFAALGDVVIGGLQHWMLGTSSLWSATLRYDDVNVENMTEAIENGQSGSIATVTVAGKNLDRGWFGSFFDGKYDDIAVPNIIYCPELIFSNLVPALDINFLNPEEPYDSENPDNPENEDKRYQPVELGGDVPVSSGWALHEVVAAWYTAFRNIALVGLLSVLVYIGIRIVISSSAGEKSQYKERIMDWLVALCLLFVMQYIMSFTINITEQITRIFAGSQTIDVIVEDSKVVSSADGSSSEDSSTNVDTNADFAFTTNLMGYMRFMVYLDDLLEKCAYLIIYLVLVVYTVMFTIIYLKRVLYMAFFTMIAPLVALTYPLDKLSDGKAQAFNLWLREYIFNALIQPMHLALYTMLMTSSMYLATTNPIYALVAIGFLFPAEKFIKKMFGFDKAQTAGGAGSFAGGALTMALLSRIRSAGKSGSSSSDGGSSGDYIDKRVDYTAFTNRSPNALIGNGGTPSPSSVSSGSGNGGTSTGNATSVAAGMVNGSASMGQRALNRNITAAQSTGRMLMARSLKNAGYSDKDINNIIDQQFETGLGKDKDININDKNILQARESGRAGMKTMLSNTGLSNEDINNIIDGNVDTEPQQDNLQATALQQGTVSQQNVQQGAAPQQNDVQQQQQPSQPLTWKDRARMRRNYVGRRVTRTIKNAPKKAGKAAGRFALKYGVAGLKGALGATVAAIPAGVTLLASGGDVGSAAKIMAAGAGAGVALGPSGEDIGNRVRDAGRDFMKAGRTAEEQKDVEANRKLKTLMNDKKQMKKLQEVLDKDGATDRDGNRLLAEDWVKENQKEAFNFTKNGSKNLATMYKVNKLARQDPNNRWSDDYKYNIAKLYDNVGKRINDDSYMESFDNQLQKSGLNQQEIVNLRQNLKNIDY